MNIRLDLPDHPKLAQTCLVSEYPPQVWLTRETTVNNQERRELFRARLVNHWDTIRTSYWFVPTLCSTGAVLMWFIMPAIDRAIAAAELTLPDWIATTTGAARATLSALAGAMVAVTGTVFSITVVTLSLTSQQFGPRLLRRFMYDLPTQFTLGIFLATGLYCLLVLRIVENREGLATPHLSVLLAVVAAAASMVLLIAFIHHIAVLIQAPHIVAAVARDLDDAVVRLFPDRIGDPAAMGEIDEVSARDEEPHPDAESRTIQATSEGYIQSITGDGLLGIAIDNDLLIRLRVRPGDFIAEKAPVADVWCRGNPDIGPTQEVAQAINETIIVGIRRTPRQDVACAVDELVEVAVRSLSPGINDPFTAFTCIDRLGASLARLAERKLPSSYRSDTSGTLRVIAEPVTFQHLLDVAFEPILHHGSDSDAILRRLLAALSSVAQHVHRDSDRVAIQHHVQDVLAAARARDSKYREAFERTSTAIEKSLCLANE